MKPFCVLIITTFMLSVKIYAQNESNYKAFSVEIDGGAAIQQNRTGGGVFEINPGYTIGSRFTAGIQFGWAGFNENKVASSILTMDYYMVKDRALRLFAGAGYGFYTNSYYSFQAALAPELKLNCRSTANMGGTIRISLEWNHVSLKAAYHFAPDLYENTSYNDDRSVTTHFKGNYLGLTVGIRIGGGNK